MTPICWRWRRLIAKLPQLHLTPKHPVDYPRVRQHKRHPEKRNQTHDPEGLLRRRGIIDCQTPGGIQYRDNRCATVVDGLERPELDALSCKVDETGKQASDLEARLFVQ